MSFNGPPGPRRGGMSSWVIGVEYWMLSDGNCIVGFCWAPLASAVLYHFSGNFIAANFHTSFESVTVKYEDR